MKILYHSIRLVLLLWLFTALPSPLQGQLPEEYQKIGNSTYQKPKPKTPAKPKPKPTPAAKPKVKVVVKNNDRDNDGIIDSMDECPDQYGKMENRGCPDSDGDGVIDSKDKCPNEKGELKNEGCPDKFKPFTETVQGVSFTMMPIQGGTFTMGSPADEPRRESDETQHSVTLSSYYMGSTEVTQALWKAVMGTSTTLSNPSNFKGDDLPVEQVSWDDCQTFIRKLNQLTGKRYRLPTEAEWEYACRAGTTTPFNTGNNLTTDQANYDGNYPYNGNAKGQYREKTTPVGSFAPNAWGLYDMHGNVWEWCSDWYGDYPTGAQTNPQGPLSGSYRVFRGGSWPYDAQDCRSAFRFSNSPDFSNYFLGFRLVSPE